MLFAESSHKSTFISARKCRLQNLRRVSLKMKFEVNSSPLVSSAQCNTEVDISRLQIFVKTCEKFILLSFGCC